MFTLEFETDNAAFDDGNDEREIIRILHAVALRVHGYREGAIYDVNGNRVGSWSYEKTD